MFPVNVERIPFVGLETIEYVRGSLVGSDAVNVMVTGDSGSSFSVIDWSSATGGRFSYTLMLHLYAGCVPVAQSYLAVLPALSSTSALYVKSPECVVGIVEVTVHA